MLDKLFGVLEFWDPLRGFGFIRIVDSQGYISRYFLHVTRIISGEPKPGAGVRFFPDIPHDTPKGINKHAAAIDAEIGEVLPKFLPKEPMLGEGGAQ